MSKIEHKIAVISNKGGVGKSTAAINIASALAKKGYSVGLFDADLHGPSMLKMSGHDNERIFGMENQILPIKTKDGFKLISIAGLLEDSDAPVIWRGPMKMKIIKDLLVQVDWGDGLDYLVIDLPPGTGDEALSICQLIPELDGFVVVTTPQDVAAIDVRKTISFSEQLKIPVIGVIENMSGMFCPHCGKEIELFGKGGGKKLAQDFGVQFLGELSFESKIGALADEGKTFVREEMSDAIKKQMDKIMYNIEYFVQNKDISN